MCIDMTFDNRSTSPPSMAQVADLGDAKDITTAAVASLEVTLERIERGASALAGAATRPGGARRVPVG